MNEVETGRFLAEAILLDPMMAQPDSMGLLRRTWTHALAGVPFEAAHKALHAYYASEAYAQHRHSVAPANIVQWWNARRRPTEAERTGTTAATRRALPPPPFDAEALRSGVDRVRAALAGSKARDGERPETAAERATAEAAHVRRLRERQCSHCGAAPGQPCVDVAGNPLTRSPAHPSRLGAQDSPPRGSADQALAEITGGGE